MTEESIDYCIVAREIFARTKYDATDDDINMLAKNMALLEEKGLGNLNKRLIDARKHSKIFETLAEHNFAIILVSRFDPSIQISYEPSINGRPPDFKIEIGNVTYWIQMKDLATLERVNRQEKTIKKIKAAAKEIKVGKFFSCMLSDAFEESSLPELIKYITEKAEIASEGEGFIFTGDDNQKAEIKFWLPARKPLSELTLIVSGDLTILNMTGLDKAQMKQSLLKAAGAFNWDADSNNINLIVMEADGKEDIDICDALFGTEYDLARRDEKGSYLEGWSRDNDGLFEDSDFSKKVAGVIVIKRKREKAEDISSLSPDEVVSRLSPEEKALVNGLGMKPDAIKEALAWKNPGPIANYSIILYMNDAFKHLHKDVQELICFDRVVYYNIRPPMGHGNFIS